MTASVSSVVSLFSLPALNVTTQNDSLLLGKIKVMNHVGLFDFGLVT